MLMVRCLVIERMVSLSQPLHVIIWQIRWGPKYRQHTGGRIGEQKASFIQTKLKYTQKPRARANQNLIKKTKDKVATKKGFNKVQRNKKKTNKKKKTWGTKNRNTPRGDTRRHWRGRGWERRGSDAGEHRWTQSGITGADGTNWQTHEGEQRLYSHAQRRGSGAGGERREKERWGKEEENNGTNTKALVAQDLYYLQTLITRNDSSNCLWC